MKFNRKAVSTSTAGLAIALVIVIAAAGAYIALNPATTQKVTTTSVSTAVSTSVSTSIVVSTVSSSSAQSESLAGAGSTFVFPLMSAWTVQYHNLFSNIQVNYQSIGSGGGIAAFEGHTVDFGASDAPLKGADITKTPNALTLPITIGAVTVAYNIPKIPNGILLTGSVVADIYLGKVTMWNDPEIVGLQTNATTAGNLPAKSILVVHRSDGSGTTFTFTGFLSADSSSWNSTIGQGKTVAWPVGLGAAGNEGVAGVVRGTQYTIGYVELAYAIQNKMTVAAIKNPSGSFVLPTLTTSAAAAQNIGALPTGLGDWSKVNLLNQPGATTYPIVTFVYLFVYKELNVNTGQTSGTSLAGSTALVQFFWWLDHTGQQTSSGLSYVPLPPNVVTINEQSLSSITYNGQTLTTH
ncbi:MAG: phosphate ABC transporter substrate-binding protein PstS [Thaumarchaeota archaeon]|nr:phosphate ABC transporter substrate-binding protein PstS [Nitrososphaerota archaeon]